MPTCAEIAEALSANGLESTASDDRPLQEPLFRDGPFTRGCTLETALDGQTQNIDAYLQAGAADGLQSTLADADAERVDFEGRTFALSREQYPYDGYSGELLGTVGVNLVGIVSSGGMEPAVDARKLDALITALGG